MSTLAFPDAEVSLVFPPTPSFPVLLDCMGILRGWRYGRTPLPIWFFPDFADDSARLAGSLTVEQSRIDKTGSEEVGYE